MTQDHIGTGAPGAYRLYKNGWVLSENGPTDKDTGAGGNSNMPLFGGAANLKSAAQNQRVDIDKADSGTGWAFTREPRERLHGDGRSDPSPEVSGPLQEGRISRLPRGLR